MQMFIGICILQVCLFLLGLPVVSAIMSELEQLRQEAEQLKNQIRVCTV